VGGIVVELMDGEGEDGSVFGEDGGGAVAVVDIGVDDHGAGDFFAVCRVRMATATSWMAQKPSPWPG